MLEASSWKRTDPENVAKDGALTTEELLSASSPTAVKSYAGFHPGSSNSNGSHFGASLTGSPGLFSNSSLRKGTRKLKEPPLRISVSFSRNFAMILKQTNNFFLPMVFVKSVLCCSSRRRLPHSLFEGGLQGLEVVLSGPVVFVVVLFALVLLLLRREARELRGVPVERSLTLSGNFSCSKVRVAQSKGSVVLHLLALPIWTRTFCETSWEEESGPR